MSDKCRYWKTQNGKIEGNPDCPGSTWKVGARTVTGDLKVNWSDTTGPGITVRAHAIGTTAVAVTHSTNKEDKSAIGSLGLLGRMPYKWAITIISAILVPGVLVAFVREASAQSGEREQNRTEDADHAGISP